MWSLVTSSNLHITNIGHLFVFLWSVRSCLRDLFRGATVIQKTNNSTIVLFIKSKHNQFVDKYVHKDVESFPYSVKHTDSTFFSH